MNNHKILDNEVIYNHNGSINIFIMTQRFGPLEKWDTSLITTMNGWFYCCDFNDKISKWKTSNVTDMSYMFAHSTFNREIEDWDISNVKNMSYMFAHTVFNQKISRWNISNVSNMRCMFHNNYYFIDIYNPEWDAYKIVDMYL